MARFKNKPLGLDSNLVESFSALSKKDISDGNIAGIASPYSADHKQAVSLALVNADDNLHEISTEISKLYKKLEYGFKIASVKHLEDFNRFSTLLLQALKINEVLAGDSVILKKLSEVLTYAYLRKNKGEFRIYSDFDAAKSVTEKVYATANKLGLDFLSPDIDDVVQKVLFSVLYKPVDKPKEGTKNSSEPPKKETNNGSTSR